MKRKEKIFWCTNQRHRELSQNWLKKNQIINWFTKNNIISKSGKFADAPKKIAESKLKESEQKSDQSISKYVQVPRVRFISIKLKINKNNKLSTTIDNKSYTINDVNNLVNKVAKKRLVKIRPLKNTIIW